jgi:hypothetical protein
MRLCNAGRAASKHFCAKHFFSPTRGYPTAGDDTGLGAISRSDCTSKLVADHTMKRWGPSFKSLLNERYWAWNK